MQKQTEIRSRLESLDIHPKRVWGQNFLIDLNLMQILLETGRVEPGDVVLEVGTGTGSLTKAIAEKAAWIVTVDIDQRLRPIQEEMLAGIQNLDLITGDALCKGKRLNPEVEAMLEKRLAAAGKKQPVLVANLPYNIAAPLLATMALHPRLKPERISCLVQKEMADRFLATPESESRLGAVSLLVQLSWHLSRVRDLNPACFWPRPEIVSTLLYGAPRTDDLGIGKKLADFYLLLQALFLSQRKSLVNAFRKSSFLDAQPEDLEIWKKFAAREHLPEDARPGTLTLEQWARFFLELEAAGRIQGLLQKDRKKRSEEADATELDA